MTLRRLLLLATLCAVALAASPATAGALAIGSPIPASPAIYRITAGSWRLEPAQAADPDGGPPWALASFLATQPSRVRSLVHVTCSVVGRLVDGHIGQLDADGVFHPYAEGAGPVGCGGQTGIGERANGYSDQFLLAHPSETPCIPSARDAPAYRLPVCDPREVRTLRSGILGVGIRSLAIRSARGGWTPIPVAADGAFVYAERGIFSDKTIPPLRVVASVCGTDARPDLLREYHAARNGCTVTYELPDSPRPAPESAASRRARRARRLHVPLHLAVRHGVAALGRYALVFRLPITIETDNEGYAYRLKGPGGPHCRGRVAVSTAESFYSSYLALAGSTLHLALLPPGGEAASWCPGRYDVQAVFSRLYETPPRRGHTPIRRYRIEIVGTTRFTVRG